MCLHCAKRTRIFSRPAWLKEGYPMSSLFALRGDTNSIAMRAALGPRINQSPGARCLGSSGSRRAPPVRYLRRARLFTVRRESPLPSKVHVYLVSGLPSSRAGGPGGCGSAPLPGILTRWKQAESTPGDTSVPLAGTAADGYVCVWAVNAQASEQSLCI